MCFLPLLLSPKHASPIHPDSLFLLHTPYPPPPPPQDLLLDVLNDKEDILLAFNSAQVGLGHTPVGERVLVLFASLQQMLGFRADVG